MSLIDKWSRLRRAYYIGLLTRNQVERRIIGITRNKFNARGLMMRQVDRIDAGTFTFPH